MDIPNTVYRINENDQITFVNDQWTQFALANDAPELAGNNVLSSDFWTFITDDTTRFLYGQLVKRAREGYKIQFQFRCDSADLRRDVEMRMSRHPSGEVEFDVRVLSVVPREPYDILYRRAKRSEDFIDACSWCNRIKLDNETWAEIDQAMEMVGAFKGDFVPQLSHGICGDCYTKMTGIFNT